MFPCYSPNSSHPLLPLLCPQVCSLCLLLYCCPANRFISTIFLDSIYPRVILIHHLVYRKQYKQDMCVSTHYDVEPITPFSVIQICWFLLSLWKKIGSLAILQRVLKIKFNSAFDTYHTSTFKKLHYMTLQLKSKHQNTLPHTNIKQQAMSCSICFMLTADVKCW